MTDLLADTHALLWWLADDPRLPRTARDALAGAAPRVCYSSASVWEIGIKHALGKLDLDDDLLAALAADGFVELPILGRHAARAAALPAHHRDPFDRMIVAQAQEEELAIVTADRRIAAYNVAVVW